MSFLDKYISGKKWKPTQQPRSLNVVKANTWDEQKFKQVRLFRQVDDLVEELETLHDDEVEQPARLVMDLFMLAYKGYPQIRTKKELDRSVKVNKQIVDILQDLPDLKALQQFSGGDPVMSLTAVQALAPHVIKLLEEAVPPPPPEPDPNEQADEQQQASQQPQQGQPDDSPADEPDASPDPDGQAQAGAGQSGDEQQDDPDGQQQGQEQSAAGDPGDSDDDDDDNSSEGEKSQSGTPDADADTDPDEGAGQGEGDPDDDAEGDPDDDEGDDESDEDEDDFDPDDWDEEPEAIDPDQARDALAKALGEAKDEIQDLCEAEQSIAGSEAGKWATDADPAERMSVLRRLKQMKKLLDSVGRMSRLALGIHATNITPSEHEMYGVQMGSNMTRILPHQFALLGHDATKPEFYKRYANRELLEWKMRGKERAGKGPIVALVDKSDSMGWGGNRMHWALACTESIRQIAEKEQRDVFVQFFDGYLSQPYFFPKGKGTPPEVLEVLSVRPSGGTSFMPPCDKAMEIIEQAPEFERADIVMITDGEGRTTPGWVEEFNATKERLGVRMFGLFIGSPNEFHQYAGPSSALAQISDHLIPVQELTIDAAQELFREF